jgi:rhodanese-related sulfurtransferase
MVFKFVRLWRHYRAYRTHRMTPGELKHRIEAGEPLVVVDLRREIEKQEGCIPGAILVAYQDLDSLVPAIGTKEVVFYCSCPDELASVRAALRLKRHGLTRLHALQGGFSGWRALGFPVDTAIPHGTSLNRLSEIWQPAKLPTSASRQPAAANDR